MASSCLAAAYAFVEEVVDLEASASAGAAEVAAFVVEAVEVVVGEGFSPALRLYMHF